MRSLWLFGACLVCLALPPRPLRHSQRFNLASRTTSMCKSLQSPENPGLSDIGPRGAIHGQRRLRLSTLRSGKTARIHAHLTLPQQLERKSAKSRVVKYIIGFMNGSIVGEKAGAAPQEEVNVLSELSTKLEQVNPTTEWPEAKSLMSGLWRLIYTSSPSLQYMVDWGLFQVVDMNNNRLRTRLNIRRSFPAFYAETFGDLTRDEEEEGQFQLKVDYSEIKVGPLRRKLRDGKIPLGKDLGVSTRLLSSFQETTVTYIDRHIKITRGPDASLCLWLALDRFNLDQKEIKDSLFSAIAKHTKNPDPVSMSRVNQIIWNLEDLSSQLVDKSSWAIAKGEWKILFTTVPSLETPRFESWKEAEGALVLQKKKLDGVPPYYIEDLGDDNYDRHIVVNYLLGKERKGNVTVTFLTEQAMRYEASSSLDAEAAELRARTTYLDNDLRILRLGPDLEDAVVMARVKGTSPYERAMVGGEEKHVNIALPTPPEPIGAILDLPTVPQQRIEDRIREMAEAKLQPQWKQKKGAVVATAPPPPKEKASPDPEISKWRDEGGALVMEDDTRTPEVSPTDEWQDLGGAKVLKDDRPIRSNDNLGGQEVGGARVWVAKKKPPPSALGDDWIEVDGALVYKAGASKKANKGQS